MASTYPYPLAPSSCVLNGKIWRGVFFRPGSTLAKLQFPALRRTGKIFPACTTARDYPGFFRPNFKEVCRNHVRAVHGDLTENSGSHNAHSRGGVNGATGTISARQDFAKNSVHASRVVFNKDQLSSRVAADPNLKASPEEPGAISSRDSIVAGDMQAMKNSVVESASSRVGQEEDVQKKEQGRTLLYSRASSTTAAQRSQSKTSRLRHKPKKYPRSTSPLEPRGTERKNWSKALDKQTIKTNQPYAQSLPDSESKASNLEKEITSGEQGLQGEGQTWNTSQQEAVRMAEKNISELTAEIQSLMVLLENKENLIQAAQEETKPDAAMLMSADNIREALLIAERKQQQLSNQITALEDEVRSKDFLLTEIKGDSIRTTEALKLATQIKQDLNASRLREVQLIQALETANEVTNELQNEIINNVRAVRAEQALSHTEKILKDVKMEVEVLRKGVQTRDEAIKLMKDEVDLCIDLLSSAAKNREELKDKSLQIEELQLKLQLQTTKLNIIREEMALVVNLAREKQGRDCGQVKNDHPFG